MLGADLKSVGDFFEFCLLHLTVGAEKDQNLAVRFTSNRFFYLLNAFELTAYRANLPVVETWKDARKCHHFWATGEGEGHVGRRWVGCCCEHCGAHNFSQCEHSEYFSVDGEDKNAPLVAEITARYPSARSKEEEIKRSTKVLMCIYIHICATALLHLIGCIALSSLQSRPSERCSQSGQAAS